MSNSDIHDPLKPPSRDDLKLRTAPPVDKAVCPMARASELIGDKWTMLILREAIFRVGSFADMLADLDISRAVLAERLARLVEHGLLKKVTYQDPGSRPRQAYVLTPFGKALTISFLALADWGQAITGKPSPLQPYDVSNQQSVRLAMIGQDGGEVPMERLDIRIET